MIKDIMDRMRTGSTGLRHKLLIAFMLMSVIPLMVAVYIVSIFLSGIPLEAFTRVGLISLFAAILFFATVIASCGFMLTRRMIDPVFGIASDARKIADGDLRHKVSVDTEDEIGELGRSINSITKRIRESMGELQGYSIKTKEVNLEIQKKVLALSSILQIGDMIASKGKLSDIMKLVVEKLGAVDESSMAALYLSEDGKSRLLPKASNGLGAKIVKRTSFMIGKDPIGVSVARKKQVKIDSSVTKPAPDARAVSTLFKNRNCLVVPVVSHGMGSGFIIVANDREAFTFKEDDVELVKVLGKQLGIAIENDQLARKAEELTIKDELTGLYNKKYAFERLDEEIKRAILYQRPCSLLVFSIDDMKKNRESYGEIAAEESLKKVADIIKKGSTEVSKVARISWDEFAVVLPERNKKEANEISDRIRDRVEAEFSGSPKDKGFPLTVSGSVSENPIDGATAEELFNKALGSLKASGRGGKSGTS